MVRDRDSKHHTQRLLIQCERWAYCGGLGYFHYSHHLLHLHGNYTNTHAHRHTHTRQSLKNIKGNEYKSQFTCELSVLDDATECHRRPAMVSGPMRWLRCRSPMRPAAVIEHFTFTQTCMLQLPKSRGDYYSHGGK